MISSEMANVVNKHSQISCSANHVELFFNRYPVPFKGELFLNLPINRSVNFKVV